MAIQSSINSLLSQAQRLATFYTGLGKVEKIVGDTTATKNETQIQTDIAAGRAPMKDGKIDPEWLQSRREKYNPDMLTSDDKQIRKKIMDEINRNNDPSLADLLAKYDTKNAALNSAIEAQATNSKLKNEVARKVAKMSVKSRTNNINKTKADFKKHLIGVKKDKGSELT